MKHYMALDWGTKKIGVALADTETRIAFAHSILGNNARIYAVVNDLVLSYDVTKIIIGVPLHTTFKENRKSIEVFGKTLAIKTGRDVLYVNEVFTSKMAQKSLTDSDQKRIYVDKRGMKRRKVVEDDAESARILLQDYLDHKIKGL
ncbi:MAG TPA: Holliday junction resolvase RuvX [Patescibacteria group bacterium]|nr:Holliday junction resolvase RuvX [Patescibacteria group bacterium]